MRSTQASSRPLFLLGASICFLCGFAATRAGAADLDRRGGPPPAVVVPRVAAARPCKLVPMPETNLEGYDVERFRPTWVCVSRGLYADTLPPPPPLRRPWWWW